MMRDEALKLQGKAEASRRRARERRPNRSKEQIRVRRLHATLAAAYSEAMGASGASPTEAARVGLKVLGLDHLSEAVLNQVFISPNWPYLLRAEIKKTQMLLLKLDEANLRTTKRRRQDAWKMIFDHGIKGVRRVMKKHNTTTNLQQVDQMCPTGLRWEISQTDFSKPEFQAERNNWLASLPQGKYDVTLSESYITVTAKTLTDVPVLLVWSSRHNFCDLSPPAMIHSAGPWSKENLPTAVESFFQLNAYHPFAQCSHPQKHTDPVPLTEISPLCAEGDTVDRKMLHFCSHRECAGLDPAKFRSNRKEVNNMDFLSKFLDFLLQNHRSEGDNSQPDQNLPRILALCEKNGQS